MARIRRPNCRLVLHQESSGGAGWPTIGTSHNCGHDAAKSNHLNKRNELGNRQSICF
ncbi:GD11506 [Drosophila simulans]|uniref:GD11506 n=1 Tax=Drosophila simulans TaxID=7240 RepID=B4QEM5_DROSI|nr:GD11506 [Drosophila simulans]